MKCSVSMIKGITFLFLILLLPFSFALSTGRSPLPSQTQMPLKYDDVLSQAFKFSEGAPAELKELEARIVIRYLPNSSQPESQIVLLKKKDGTVRIIHYSLEPGSSPIAERYDEALKQNSSAKAETILKGVHVIKSEHAGDGAINQLATDFSQMSIPANLNSDLCMDGMTYELWVQTPSNEIHASLSSCAYGKSTDSAPIIQWIKALHSKLQKRN